MTQHTIQLFEFGAYQPLPEYIDLALFKTYLKEVWNNRHLFYEHVEETEPDTEEKQADVHRQGQALLQFDGHAIRACNYVGFIHYQGTTIHILPKIFSAAGMAEAKVMEHLLFYLSYASPMRFPFSGKSADTSSHHNFLQLLIYFFAVLTEKTLAEHPYHTYQEVNEQSAFVRGRLDIPAYTRHSLSNGQWHALQVRHTPFIYDNTFNQLVKYTVQLLVPVGSASNLPLLHHILFILNEVSSHTFTYQDCEQLTFTNLPHDHQQVLSLCKLFLANQQLKLPQLHELNFSFLVPMERVFEDFTGNFIKKHFPELQMQLQSATSFAMINGQVAFHIRNDIWLPQRHTIIDTKYKLLDFQTDGLKNGVENSDIYQMLAYAISRKSTRVHLIYPGTGEQLPESIVYCIENNCNGQVVQIHIHQIPMIINRTAQTESTSIEEKLVPVLKEKLYTILYT